MDAEGSGTPELYTPGKVGPRCREPTAPILPLNWFYPRVWMSSNGTIFGFSAGTEGNNAGTIFTIDTTGRGSVTNLGHTPFESESIRSSSHVRARQDPYDR